MSIFTSRNSVGRFPRSGSRHACAATSAGNTGLPTGRLCKSRPTLFAALALACTTAFAQQSARQDLNQLKLTVEQFLQSQVAGMAGQVGVAVGPIDQRMALAACPQPQAFFMPGARAWGKTTVGVRCASPSAWTVYIQANVSVQANYVASAVPLAQGQPIEATQLAVLRGDLTTLPAGVATDIAQVIGRSSNVSLAAGTPLRLDTLRSKPVVQSGQLVKLVSGNASFRVSSDARAVAAAAEGQMVAVRTASGSQVTGIARAGGLVEVAF